MKKLFAILLSAIMLVGTVFALTACGANAKVVVLEYHLTAESYAFAINKEVGAEVKAAANELLADMEESGELDTLINSYFDGTSTFEYTNPASKEGCLVVATNAQFPPFEYKNGNKFTGIDMEIAKKLADKMGKTLYIDDMEFDSVITSVQTQIADIGMAGMTVTEKRKEAVDFSTEYYESAQVIMVLEGDDTFADCESAEDIVAKLAEQDSTYKIGTQKGTTGYMYSYGDVDFGYDGFKNVETKAYDNGALAVQDMLNGKINAVIIDEQPAKMIAATYNK